MAVSVYFISAAVVFVFSGVLAMAGLGAAFLFVPLFYYLGVPLAAAASGALGAASECGQSTVCCHQLLARPSDQLAGRLSDGQTGHGASWRRT